MGDSLDTQDYSKTEENMDGLELTPGLELSFKKTLISPEKRLVLI